MERIRSLSLRFRLLVLVIAVVTPALGVVLYTGLQQRSQAAAEARREATGLARSVVADQQRLVVETRQFLSLLAQLPPVLGEPGSCGSFLAPLLEGDDRFANLGVILADGELACSALPADGPVDLADRAYFRRALATGEFSVGDYQIGRVTGEASVNFATPILDDQGRAQGVVYAALPLRWLSARLADARLPPGSVIMVLDPAFTVLARYPSEGEWTGRSIAGSSLPAAIRRIGGEGTVEAIGPDGVDRLYAIAPLQDRREGRAASVMVGIPSRVAYAAVDRGLLRNLSTLSLLGLLMLAAAWWGTEVFVLLPVRALLKATRRLGAGELGARAPAAGGGEMRELGSAFNAMAADLQERDREITEHLGRIARLNRVHAVLSGINSAILRIRERQELLDEVCRIAVEQGGMGLALVHRVDAEGAALAAWSSRTPGERVPPPSPEADAGSTALVEAVLREEGAVVAHVEGSDPRLAGWRALARSRGCHSAAALPLRVDGSIVGVLSLFVEESGFFDEAELRLLRELAADASLGLQHMENEQRLHYLANYDTLTDLPNRALFEDRLHQALARAKQHGHRVGVMVVGIDRLPEIGATLGNHASDEVLREMGSYLAGAAGEGETVARLGSGEFGLVLDEAADVEGVTTRVRELMEGAPQVVSAGEEQLFVSLSVGVAIYPLDGGRGALLVQNASLARQATTSEVASTVTFHSPEINSRARERRRMEHELRSAVEREQLVLFYQPVVNVETRRVVGVESLVRWDSPELGFVSPAAFIPVAEETGLINPIGEWIVATACRQGRLWSGRGVEGVRVNVNVSVDQLRKGDFVERVEAILAETGFDPSRLSLGLEITESEIMENLEEAVDCLTRFRAMGLAIYIDDFGTGYSSLAYLRQLPIDTLKIDTSFIRDLPGDADAVAVVKGIIAMAHSLELRVIAEGVETEAQFEVLQRLGCEAVQGYLFARPGPPEEIEPLFGRVL